MSAHQVSEQPSTPASAARPSAGALSIADPVPVGIAGFGMTTFILSCVNAGFFGGTSSTPMVLGLPHLPKTVAGNAIGLYLLGWLIFTFYMTIAALKTNVAVLGVFITLTATYLLLALAEFGINPADLQPIAGYIGITCGVTAWYVAFAHVTNATFGREFIPTWPLSARA